MYLLFKYGDKTIKNNKSDVTEVEKGQLPLSCPMPGQSLWNQHPKVYLPIKPNQEVTCPYCGSKYRLKD